MAGSINEQGPFSVLVSNDYGLDEFSIDAVQPDSHGVPTNLMLDTEYAMLTEQQSRRWWTDSDIELETQDKKRYPGAFAIRFAARAEQPQIVVESTNRFTQLAATEQVRAGQ